MSIVPDSLVRVFLQGEKKEKSLTSYTACIRNVNLHHGSDQTESLGPYQKERHDRCPHSAVQTRQTFIPGAQTPLKISTATHRCALAQENNLTSYLEGELLVEGRVQSLPVHFGLKLLLLVGQEVNLHVGVRRPAHVHGRELGGLDDPDDELKIREQRRFRSRLKNRICCRVYSEDVENI